MSENQETTQVAEKNFIAKWIDVYFSPAETFTSLDRKPDWLVPMILLAVLTVISVFLIAPQMQDMQIQAMMDRGMSEDEAYTAYETSAAFMKYLTPVFGVIGVFLVSLIIAGIFFVVFNFMMGGESTYKKVLSVYCYIAFGVGLIGTIVRVPLVMAKNSMEVQTSLAAFLSIDMKDQFIYKLLAKFDVFVVWELILFIIGFQIIYKFSRGKAATGVLALFGLYVVISIVLGNIFSSLGG